MVAGCSPSITPLHRFRIRGMRHSFRTLAISAWTGAASIALLAQTPSPTKPVFEVASVRPNHSESTNSSMNLQPGGRVTGTNQTVRDLIRNSWNLQPYQIVGGADWIAADHFDIVAKVADADMGPGWTPKPEDFMLRMQSLLEDRFKLVTHKETRE